MKRGNALHIISVLILLAVVPAGCNVADEEDETGYPSFPFQSVAFSGGTRIPDKYTCTGEDVSPPLQWTNIPYETRSFALIVKDKDVTGGFVHWVVYNIPSDFTSLPENVPDAEIIDSGARQGRNDFNNLGYGGPCPPSGTHRYVFTLYALDTMLDVPAGADAPRVREAMEGHIIAVGALTGTYSR